MKVEWPGRCVSCDQTIDDWADAGMLEGRWIHKACYVQRAEEARNRNLELPNLRSPADRSSVLELPMFIFLLLFHFGLGFGVIGWILITQGQPDTGYPILVLGIVSPLAGIAGIAVNIISRRRIELIRQSLELHGGWRAGR